MDIAFRPAALEDSDVLASMNARLIRDEGHKNAMTVSELATRMRNWLAQKDYEATILLVDGQSAGYALYAQNDDNLYIRQLFIEAAHRRGGLGRQLVNWVIDNVADPKCPIRIEVLSDNARGHAFWRGVGFNDYCTVMERQPAP